MKFAPLFIGLCLLLISTATLFGQSVSSGAPRFKQFALGVIDSVQSAVLGETRVLNIYLPDGYSADSLNKYPTIYLLDGSANEGFIHIAGLVQYANFPWVNWLPKSLVVGIANVDRRRDFTFPTTIAKDKQDFPTTGHSEKFIAFLEQELQPYIQKKYSSHPSKTLIGQSLGGLITTEILFKKPTLFTHYLIISPSLWWDNESLLAIKPAFLQPTFRQKTSVFIAVGKEGNVMETDAKRLLELVKKTGPNIIKTDFHYFADENHATILHLAVYRAFERFKKE